MLCFLLFVSLNGFRFAKKHKETFIFDELIDDTTCVHHCCRI